VKAITTVLVLSFLTVFGACASGQTAAGAAPAGERASSQALGVDDVIAIHIAQAPELAEKPVRIDLNGFVDLPWIGKVKAAGETVESLRDDLVTRFKAIIQEPQITVTVEELHSQPVSVVGAVNTPGVVQVHGRKTLLEMLSLAGGLRTDSGSVVNITRRKEWGPIGVPGEKTDAASGFSTATVDLRQLMEARDPGLNVPIQPNDVIAVPRAHMVFVIGEVNKPGSYPLSDREEYSVLEALSLAGGLTSGASPQQSKILRPTNGGATRQEIAVDLRKLLAGHGSDCNLHPDDILFVPTNGPKKAGMKAIDAVLQAAIGMAWRL
jgi:polysaccharide export outer membrane protein